MLDDIRHRLRVLEGARSMIGDTATEGAIAGLRLEFGAANVDSLLAELRAQYTRFGPIVQVASADGSGHLDGVTQTVVLGDQHVHPLPENTELARQQVDLSAYLRWIRSFYNQLPMSSLDPSDVEHAPLELSPRTDHHVA